MSTTNTAILIGFNNHFKEFMTSVMNVFPDNADIAAANKSVKMLCSANPKLLCLLWRDRVAIPYGKNIDDGDIQFFLEKDYTEDLADAPDSHKIIEIIDGLRGPIRAMNQADLANVITFVRNLNSLSIAAIK